MYNGIFKEINIITLDNNETITLYAIFNSGTYTVAYNLNGGTFESLGNKNLDNKPIEVELPEI